MTAVTVWKLDVPSWHGRPPLTDNMRLHWRQRAERVRLVREGVHWLAKSLKIPTHEHITVQLHYAPGDNRRRDEDNLNPTSKAACDGLVDAGIVPDDTPRYMTKLMPKLHQGPGVRRLWLEIEATR